MAENKVNKWENLNYQSSQLEEEDLQKLEANSVPINMHQKTDPLVFEEVYSVAREARNKWWSAHREPSWTKRNSLKFYLPSWKQTRKQISYQLPWLVYEVLIAVQ